jgi:hypothetical protein
MVKDIDMFSYFVKEFNKYLVNYENYSNDVIIIDASILKKYTPSNIYINNLNVFRDIIGCNKIFKNDNSFKECKDEQHIKKNIDLFILEFVIKTIINKQTVYAKDFIEMIDIVNNKFYYNIDYNLLNKRFNILEQYVCNIRIVLNRLTYRYINDCINLHNYNNIRNILPKRFFILGDVMMGIRNQDCRLVLIIYRGDE